MNAHAPTLRTSVLDLTVRYTWLLWAVVLASVARTTIFVRPRAVSEFATVDASAYVAILLVAVGALLVAATPWRDRFLYALRGGSGKLLLLYFALCGASALWSINPKYTIFRASEVTCQFLLVGALLYYRARDFELSERRLFGLTWVLVVMDIAMHLRISFPNVNLPALHTNISTFVAAMLAAYCFSEWFTAQGARRRWLFRHGVGFLFITMLGTSAGSNVALLVAVLLAAVMQGVYRKPAFIAIFILAMAIAFVSGLTQDFLWDVVLAGKKQGSVEHVSGRAYLWQAYMDAIRQRVVLGYGFVTVARMGEVFGTIGTTSAHNGYIEAALGCGMVGIAALLFWLKGLGSEVRRAFAGRLPGAAGFAAALCVALVNNLTMPVFGGAWSPVVTAFFAMLMFFAFSVMAQRPAGLQRS